ncbi:recombinase family protein [Paraburkholderia humisilvae]|uniref:Resolvase/invertase-type recombinase catalytic domain-containing protein n=1 Tax=Paraburkholderia humisilvae TaxID=627669 RepID=A0A6J5F757_9BURK|nr:recombinase family protein [Paraburkholderia humisilvae]CAB3774720.1 hypothetical protein LMG29542_08098 [Paraburkholderia humisilvae]
MRPGFEQLLSLPYDGEVGAVLGIKASRLTRNGRDWHTLLESCNVVRALLTNAEGVYYPVQVNDRPLLGMKGNDQRDGTGQLPAASARSDEAEG